MGKVSYFEIRFSNVEGVFYAGQPLTGKIVLHLKSAMKMKGITLYLSGKAGVKWMDGNNIAGKNKTYRNEETYFDHTQLVYGRERGDNSTLPAGEHSLDFQFQLPPDSPTTFEGLHGGIRYFAKAKMERPWKFDVFTKQPFTVINSFDLNTLSTSTHPQSAQKRYQESGFCACWGSRPISVQVRTDRTGYVPGESIKIDAEIINDSSRTVCSTRAILRQYVNFTGTHQGLLTNHSKSKTNFNDIAELKHKKISPKHSDIWTAEECHIPCVPPSDLHGCSFIDIKYILRFVMKVEECCSFQEVVVEIPMTVGTIPLASTLPGLPSYASISPASITLQQAHFGTPPALPSPTTSAPVSPTSASAPPLDAEPGPSVPEPSTSGPSAPPMWPGRDKYDIAPPSYEECIFGESDTRDEEDNQYTMGKTKYTPRYAYYSSQ